MCIALLHSALGKKPLGHPIKRRERQDDRGLERGGLREGRRREFREPALRDAMVEVGVVRRGDQAADIGVAGVAVEHLDLTPVEWVAGQNDEGHS